MPNCSLQDAVITVTSASRYGLPYDLAHVETIFQLDSQLQPEDVFLVPGDQFIPNEIMNILRLAKLDFTPMSKSEVVANLSDFTQEVTEQNREAVIADAAIGLAAVYMKPVQFQQIGSSNLYRVSYDYTIFPNQDNNFYVYARLPFRSFPLSTGGQIRLVVVLPAGAQFDPAETQGVALNGQVIEEQQAVAANDKQVISFFYQNDPDFTVKYRY
ncbi:MAG: hypothetical protein ACYCX4_14825 [Bacillota bacterium]